ncbi:MAG TPA: hypothetical protein VF062_13965 [Candidatus Limnocylindrales bacterium]
MLRVAESHSNPYPWDLGPLPRFSLYGGGRVIVAEQGKAAVRSAREFKLSAEQYRELVERAYAAGLWQSASHEYTDQTDSSVLLVTLRTEEGTSTTRVVAPEVDRGGARERVLDFVAGLPATPGTAGGYRPSALAVLATGGVDDGGKAPRPWPMHPLNTGTRTREGQCVVVTGAELDRALDLGKDLVAKDSRWSSDAKTFAVSFRPLLPDERHCADLAQP